MLIGVVVVKETLFRFVFRVGLEVQSTAVKTDARHHRSDAITSASAFVGITIALIGGVGWESADDWAALFASVIIAYNAYRLFTPAMAEVMDAAASPHLVEDVRKVAMAVDGVIGLDKCFVRKIGFDHYVDLHVVVQSALTVRRGHEIGHAVKDAICLVYPRITDVLVHIEPDDVLKSTDPGVR